MDWISWNYALARDSWFSRRYADYGDVLGDVVGNRRAYRVPNSGSAVPKNAAIHCEAVHSSIFFRSLLLSVECRRH